MARDTQIIPTSATVTNTEFRQVCQFFANVLQTGGIVKTSDTGQIDLASANFPAANSTSAGYEMRQMSDAMQSVQPVFMRIQYYRGGNAGQIVIGIQFGKGSNGAGGLTGAVGTETLVSVIGTATRTGVSAGFANTNSFVLRFGYGNNTAGNFEGIFSVERTNDRAGSVTDKGVMFIYKNAGQASAFSSRFFDYYSGAPVTEESGLGGSWMPSGQTTGLYASGYTAVYPFYVFGIGETLPPSRNIAGVFTANVTPDAVYTIYLSGQGQEMKILNTQGAYGRGTLSPTRITAMRFDN